jgi:DnaJ-class molecular chaperone
MTMQTDGRENATDPRGASTIRNPGDETAPGTPQTGETTCPECHGTGRAPSGECPNCGGTGRVVQTIGDA